MPKLHGRAAWIAQTAYKGLKEVLNRGDQLEIGKRYLFDDMAITRVDGPEYRIETPQKILRFELRGPLAKGSSFRIDQVPFAGIA
ncbi:hypothetical protein CMI45_00940 [Candidatus Pacearchaeota archaeon]|nr:hypothetical protein [Candidatus Pacearchaeota archaeon]|tara:strand:+ start:619 stop:873 length:255 start_codon:yes stop_codon:yes gene_type:complete